MEFNTPLSTPLESLLLILSCHSLNITYAHCHAVHQTSQPHPHPGRCLLTPQCMLGSGLCLGIFAGSSPSPQALLRKAPGNEPFALLSAHFVFPAPSFPASLLPSLKGSHSIYCLCFSIKGFTRAVLLFWFCPFQTFQVLRGASDPCRPLVTIRMARWMDKGSLPGLTVSCHEK